MSKSKDAWGSESGPSETEQARMYDWAAMAGARAAPLGPDSARRGGRAEDVHDERETDNARSMKSDGAR